MHRKINKTDKQSGFSGLILTLIIILVLALGTAGWYVWRQNQKNDDGAQTNTTSQWSQNQSQDTTQSTDSVYENYLVIEEWGVQLPLSDQISEAYYSFRVDDLAEYVELYDADFDRLKNANGVSCGQGHEYQIYSISRVKKENVGELNDPAGPEYKELSFTNQYVFGGLGAHQAPPYCADLSKAPQDKYTEDSNIIGIVDEKETAFENAFEELQPLQ